MDGSSKEAAASNQWQGMAAWQVISSIADHSAGKEATHLVYWRDPSTFALMLSHLRSCSIYVGSEGQQLPSVAALRHHYGIGNPSALQQEVGASVGSSHAACSAVWQSFGQQPASIRSKCSAAAI
jgi:hypothetical protein